MGLGWHHEKFSSNAKTESNFYSQVAYPWDLVLACQNADEENSLRWKLVLNRNEKLVGEGDILKYGRG